MRSEVAGSELSREVKGAGWKQRQKGEESRAQQRDESVCPICLLAAGRRG